MSITAPTYIFPPLDSNPDTLYQGFVDYMQTNIPGWTPYTGELDDWLGRVFSSIAAQLTEVTSDVATSIYRYFGANIINVPPIEAQSAIALATITVQDTAGYTVPAFTQMTLTDPSGNQQAFETTSDVVIASSATTATNVALTAVTPGSAGNGCSGTASNCPVAFVTSIVTTTSASGGTDDEDDTTYLNRLTNTLQTLSPKPITVNDFDTIVLDQPSVGRVTTIAGFNPANNTGTGNTHTSATIDTLTTAFCASIPVGASISGSGIPSNTFVTAIASSTSITISAPTTTTVSGTTLTIGGSIGNAGDVGSIVADANGVALSSPTMATIQAAIQAQLLVGVNFFVTAPTSTPVNVTATVVAWPGQDTVATQAAVVAVLSNFLTPLQWGLQNSGGTKQNQWLNDNVVRCNVLEGKILALQAVHYIQSIQINSLSAGVDLPLAGIVPTPAAGAMTITVTTG